MKKYSLICWVALLLSACGTSPEPTYYTMALDQGDSTSKTAAVIRVERPSLADYLNRPEFVYGDGPYQVSIDDRDHWAEPMDMMFARILAGDLQQRLPASIIVIEDNAASRDARFTVDMIVQKFNSTNKGDATLQGSLIITDKKDSQKNSLPVDLTDATSPSPSAVTEELGKLVGKLADQIVEHISARMDISQATLTP